MRRDFEFSLMSCETTEDLAPIDEIIGQERAVRALKFGLEIKEITLDSWIKKYL